MNNEYLRRYAQLVLILSILLIIALGIFGVFIDVMDSLFNIISLDLHKEIIFHKYPLGYWGALAVYFAGAIGACFCLRHKIVGGIILIGAGVIALLFGGHLALAFGSVATIFGGVFIVAERKNLKT